ncbi:MAG: Chemotaxis protein CheR [Sphingobacteriales bacterium]|nr:Chemotaxis protein CheR [Sphingobacteriales bacterium]
MFAGNLTDEQIELLLNDVWEHYGYDFTHYSKASIKRRLNRIYILDRFPSFAVLRYRVKNDTTYFKRFLEEITVNVTEMFRDPLYYKVLREKVLPSLGTYPFIRIWIAGCSTGEEAYSIAIILKEINLYHKAIIYATDINQEVLAKANEGIFKLSEMKTYSENYIASGGSTEFSAYYSANYEHAKFNDDLKDKLNFSQHNLVSDYSFNSFQLVICRNVLIYFDKELQSKVLNLFNDSLENLGYLALGSKETIQNSTISSKFKQFENEKIWRKIN